MKCPATILVLLLLSISGWAQSNLVTAEYFFDTDPGQGAALPITGFSPSLAIDVNDMIDVSTLSIGMHTMGIRVMDDNNVWSMAEYIPVFVTLSSANIVSNVTLAEYFFDTDPGMGAGIPITLSATQNIDINDMFPTSALPLGMHTLNIRIRNEYNEWSMAESIPIFVTLASANFVADIVEVEYFFDSDPGIGLATSLTITAAQIIDINDFIATGAIAVGIHTLSIRIRTVNGEWSLTESIPVYIDQDKQITQLEYFVDTDPGIGSATPVSLATPSNTIDEDIIVSTGALGVGAHTMNVRVGGSSNIWGVPESVPFTICNGAVPDFTAGNTCIGNATNFTDISTGVLGGDLYAWDFENDGVTDDVTIGDVSFTYSSPGTHVAELQIDQGGCIGYKYAMIEVTNPPTASTGADQTICESEVVSLTGVIGGGATSSLWSTSGGGNFDDNTSPVAIYTPDATDIASGSVLLTLSASEPLAACTDAVSQTTITIQSQPTANAGTNQTVCSDAIVSLSGVVGGSATTGLWTTNGTGGFADPNNAITTYTLSNADIAAGSITMTLTAFDPLAACTDATSQTTITINEDPIPLAGSDQSICSNDIVNLTGMISGDYTSQLWSTSGTGTFDNNTQLAATYTPSTADIAAGSVILTLTASAISPCSDVTSQLTLSINSTITVVEQTTDVSIGIPVNIDVFNGSTSSFGDVLTTTIIQEPTKGTATLLSDGTIDYVAGHNNVGLDVIGFQVCNQCGSCDANNALMNILNEPPTIVVPAATAMGGSMTTISLSGQLSDINGNIDLSTLEIIVQPISGAFASIDAFSNLIIDYTGITYSGTDQLTLRVCDFLGACTEVVIFIEVEFSVDPPITIFNAVSPNGDEKHDFLEIENVIAYPGNKLIIFNRWGKKVYEVSGYDNDAVKFTGFGNRGGAKELPSGTYYYQLDLGNGSESNGYFVLKN